MLIEIFEKYKVWLSVANFASFIYVKEYFKSFRSEKSTFSVIKDWDILNMHIRELLRPERIHRAQKTTYAIFQINP